MEFPGSEGPGVITGDGKVLTEAGAGGSVCVIGGSNGAAQAALGCALHSNHVYLLARSPVVDSMSDYQISALSSNPKITVIQGDSIAKLIRDEHGNPQMVETVKGQHLPVKALGAFLGSIPETEWVPKSITLAKGGRVPTNSNFETSMPGVYAVGDMRDGAIGRVGVAVGEGQFALREANAFLTKQKNAQTADADTYRNTNNYVVTSDLITRLFALDRANPWLGQTVEDVKPLVKKNKAAAQAAE
jgi:thioredoxin reductase (NADPH)